MLCILDYLYDFMAVCPQASEAAGQLAESQAAAAAAADEAEELHGKLRGAVQKGKALAKECDGLTAQLQVMPDFTGASFHSKAPRIQDNKEVAMQTGEARCSAGCTTGWAAFVCRLCRRPPETAKTSSYWLCKPSWQTRMRLQRQHKAMWKSFERPLMPLRRQPKQLRWMRCSCGRA